MEGGEQPSVPAGWYPDPNGSGLRYWDGTAWTTQTAPAQGEAAAGREAEGKTATSTARQTPETTSEQSVAGASGGTAAAGSGQLEAAKAQTAAGTQAAATADTHVAHGGGRGDRPGRLEWLLSVLLPIVPLAGLIWGFYLKRQAPANENPANVAIILSLVVILVLVLVLR